MPLRAVSARLPFLLIGTALASSLAAPALAQLVDPAPVRQSIDAFGVDLFLGTFNTSGPALTIGTGSPQGFAYSRIYQGNWKDGYTPYIRQYGSVMTISFGGSSESFNQSGSTYTTTEANGSTLTYASGVYTYTRRDGMVMHFATSLNAGAGFAQTAGRATDISLPTGEILTYSYESIDYCGNWKPSGGDYICTQTLTAFRIATVTTNYGYRLSLSYDAIEPPGEYPGALPDFATWGTPVSASVTNLAVASGASTPTQTFGITTSGGNTYYQITDQLSRVTKFRMSSGQIVGVTVPGSGSENMTIAYSGSCGNAGKVASVTVNGGTTTYCYSDSSGIRTVTVTDPQSHVTTYTFDIASQRMKSVTNGLSQTTRYFYDGNARLTYIVAPEGTLDGSGNPASGYTKYTYDGRGNVTEARRVAKSGSGLSDIYTTASFDSSCSYAAKCNSPNSTQDALGHQTDYIYDNTTGHLLSVTLPAPTGTSRPVTVYSYSNYQAYYKNSGGSIVASGQNVSLLTQISTCRTTGVTSATTTLPCSNGTDEARTAISYGPQTSGTGNNLLPVSVTRRDGSNAISATTALTYDDIGNVLTVDGPLSGTDDTTRLRYDALRRLVGKVAPDPDDGGTSKFPAARYSYDSWGHAYLAESGTVNSLSDGDWSAFSQLQNTLTEYDGYGRPVRLKSRDGSNNIYQVADTVYDSMSRVLCTRVRMDLGNLGSASDSCSTIQTSGSNGPDRVTYNTYDTLGRVSMVTSGYGTGIAANDQTLVFTNNGLLATMKDAEANLTTYEYDGHDRLVKTRFPDTTKGANSSSTADYEQIGYDANGNVTSFRTRRAETVSLSYDNLNRLTLKDVPARSGLSSTYTRDVYYGYDLLGNMTYARFDSTSGEGVSNSYDALGRLTDTTLAMDSASRTLSYQYDSAGNLIKLGQPDGNYINYYRTGSGRFWYTDLQYYSPLFHLPPDAQGRPWALYRWDTGGANWNQYSWFNSWDGISRLTTLIQEFSGTANDVTSAFGYNPASQITSRTQSNDAYAWTGAANVNRGYTSNGLNQYGAVGGTSFSYDTNGNLTSDGTNTYVYDVENRLVSRSSSSNSATMRYDPLGRLYETVGSSTGTTRFLYDGNNLVAEYDGAGTLLRRYVHGVGVDQPLVWFEGSSVSDSARRYLYADERGSIVAVTNSAGSVQTINRYDEYGIPDLTGNIATEITTKGRFRYTGQAYIPEMGMYYYKARMYSPTLGRFMQTDPIGYGDGANMYNYVHSDPVNGTDPLGLKDRIKTPPTPPAPGDKPDPPVIEVTGARLHDNVLDAIAHVHTGGLNSEPLTEPDGVIEVIGTKLRDATCPATTPIDITKDGSTIGRLDGFDGSRYLTSLDGDLPEAMELFSLLSSQAGETGVQLGDGSGILARSTPRGLIQIRLGIDYQKGVPNKPKIGTSPRIDIRANALLLRKAETIHFNNLPNKGRICVPSPAPS